MEHKPLGQLLVLQTALEYLLQQGGIRLSGDEPKDYDPKGFHVGPREGHYFKPGEREAGGKEVEIVQAPEAESIGGGPTLGGERNKNPDSMQEVHDYQESELEGLTGGGGDVRWPGNSQADVTLKASHEMAGDVYREIAGAGDDEYINSHLSRIVSAAGPKGSAREKEWEGSLSEESIELNNRFKALIMDAPAYTERQKDAKALMLAIATRDPLYIRAFAANITSKKESDDGQKAEEYIGVEVSRNIRAKRRQLLGLSDSYEMPKGAEAVEINLSKLLVLESALEHLAKATLKGEHSERDSEEFVFQKSMKNVVKVGDVDIPVEIALDPVRGLSGRGSMNPGTGMLFRMVNARDFWMKDMRFPLDIIWINDKREVVDISENLPIPTAASHFLPLYSPKRLAVYALEINGGEAKALGINIGDAVEINVS